MNGDTFHRIMRPIIVSAQFLGIFPVLGAARASSSTVQFRWCSFQASHSVVIIVCSLLMSTTAIRRVVRSDVNFTNIMGVYFFIDTTIIVGLMVLLASGWSQVLAEVNKVERVFLGNYCNRQNVRLKVHCWTMAAGWIILGTEHILSAYDRGYNQYRESLRCGWLYSDAMEYVARRNYAYIFNWMPYNIPVLFFVHYVNYAITMAWTYQDVLIMAISMYLIARYRQFFGRIEDAASASVPQTEFFWMEIREHYVMLSELLEKMDQLLSPLVISSCSNNIFLICYQLLHSLESHSFAISFVYFWFSLVFLIGRTLTTLLTAAELNRQIKCAQETVHRIPSDDWCEELERYYLQLRMEVGALSGRQFFFLTHRTAFTIATMIFTYELVTLKYSQMAGDVGVLANCSAMAFSLD